MCQTMTAHCGFVWSYMMPKCAATSYAVVAHSAGGYCFENLWARHRDELVKKLGCLIFTDSSYSAMLKNLTSTEVRLLKRIGRHYKCYKGDHLDVGEEFKTHKSCILEVSAGTSEHVLSTGVSTKHICGFI